MADENQFIPFNIKMPMIGLVFALLFSATSSNAQTQYRFHYNIPGGDNRLYYYYIDTLPGAGGAQTITVHQFFPGAIPSVSNVISGGNTFTTDLRGGLVTCGKLKAGLSQKDNDSTGKIYVDIWAITDTSCSNAGFINSQLRRGVFYYQIAPSLTMGDPTGYMSFTYSTTEIGVATVPFRYRFGRQKDTIHVPNDASANISVGVYVGRKWGRTHFYGDKAKMANSLSLTVGAFFAPTVIPLSPTNTFPTTDTVITKQIANKPNELGISTGIAAMLSIRDLSVGFFGGVDLPLSGSSKLWYYAKKPWIGFGIGYKISILGEK